MNKTKIEWVKNPDGTQGYSWNPITGCLNGCLYCYARKLANGRLRERYLANHNIAPSKVVHSEELHIQDVGEQLNDPFYPRFWPERLEKMRSTHYYNPDYDEHRLPFNHFSKGIFTCDMSDLFGIGVPEDWTRKVLEVIEECPEHRFYLLTKQPQNLQKFSPFPDNAWVGVSATGFDMFAMGVYYLSQIEAKVKYISFEPLIDRVISDEIGKYNIDMMANDYYHYVDWLIIGAQTKPYNPPKIEWVREIVEAADKAGVPVFLKDNLKPLFKSHSDDMTQPDFGIVSCFPEIELRQEMPVNANSSS